MKEIVFRLTLCTMLLALCSFAEAQQQPKVPKIGWLEVRPDDSRTSFELFKRELRALGYVEGKSVALSIETRGISSTGCPLSLMSWSI